MEALDDLKTLTVEEAATLLAVRPEAVRIWVREGALEAMKWGRRLHIRPEALKRFQEDRSIRPLNPEKAVAKMRNRRTYARP
jgi:excisionase family DNA binding protein